MSEFRVLSKAEAAPFLASIVDLGRVQVNTPVPIPTGPKSESQLVAADRALNRPWRFIADKLGVNEIDLRRRHDPAMQQQGAVAPKSEVPPELAHVSGTKRRVVDAVRAHPGTRNQIAERLRLSPETTVVYLSELKRERLLTFHRAGGETVWRAVEQAQ